MPAVILTASPRARRSPHGGLGIIRSLGRLGVPVYTVDSHPRGPGSYSRYVRERFIFEIDTDRPERTIDALVAIGRRLAHRPLLISTWDEASIMVSDHAGILAEHFRFPLQPAGLARSLASKQAMYLLARDHGVPTPMASFPRNSDDVEAYLASATFPVMLKGITGNRLLMHAGRKMAIVETPAELRRLQIEMEDPAEPNLMLQEYIPGGDDAVWMFNGYFDADSRCLLGITGRKLRQTPVYTGATSLGVCLPNEAVDADHAALDEGTGLPGHPRHRLPFRCARRQLQGPRRQPPYRRHVQAVRGPATAWMCRGPSTWTSRASLSHRRCQCGAESGWTTGTSDRV